MKRLPVITSVESQISFFEEELKKVITKHPGFSFWKKDPACKKLKFYDFESMSTTSVNIPLKGSIQISFAVPGSNQIQKMQIPVRTYFFVSCISGKTAGLPESIKASLS